MALEKRYTPTLGHGFLLYEKVSLSVNFIWSYRQFRTKLWILTSLHVPSSVELSLISIAIPFPKFEICKVFRISFREKKKT